MTDIRLGYALSSEEHQPRDLVAHTALAEAAGFDFAMISDHFHPWTSRQGQSPFVGSAVTVCWARAAKARTQRTKAA